ncbi:MAG: hypothetical protein ACKO3N_17510 [Verrucomicrobiota bacterium]
MDRHIIQWTAPSLLWTELNSSAPGRTVFPSPSILRFATDSFMQDYLDVLATDPRKLGEFRAVPETWRGKLAPPVFTPPGDTFQLSLQRRGNTALRPATTGTVATPAFPAGASVPRLKLYQPAHQRHYLLSACLVCQRAGLPDRKVDAGRQEKVSFVMRRLIANAGQENDSPETWPEYAWVDRAWVRVVSENRTRNEVILDREERLPLFPAAFQEDDQRGRRLFSGVIPVARRDAYLGAQKRDTAVSSGQPAGTTSKTARKILFRTLVADPWKNLISQAASAQKSMTEPPPDGSGLPDLTDSRKKSREQIQLVAWLVLLDFAQFLKEQLPKVSQVIAGTLARGQLTPAEENLLLALDRSRVSSVNLAPALQQASTITTVASSLTDALRRIVPFESVLESATTPYTRDQPAGAWPNFLFPLADPQYPSQAPLPPILTLGTLSAEEQSDLLLDQDPVVNDPLERVDKLVVLLVRALPETPANPEPAIPTAAIPPVDNRDGIFRIRCVYERPACGPVHLDVVSQPTETFELAGYFDPDAPTRPIRIGLPVDTTPAGLRKFDKNTAFIMSDILCGQVAKMRSLTFGDLVRSVLPFPFHKDISVGDMGPCGGGNGFGTICSLSIPIITLCALILLIIMVTLLDFVFRWLPFLILCFPVPGLKGKK